MKQKKLFEIANEICRNKNRPRIGKLNGTDLYFDSKSVEKVYSDVLKYFLKSKDSAYNANKGLFLPGKIGIGKTLLLQVFSEYFRQFSDPRMPSFRVVPAREIIEYFAEHHNYDPYHLNKNGYSKRPVEYLCIDDIGWETIQSSRYGEKINLITDLINNRYDLWSGMYSGYKPGKYKIILTTHLSQKEFVERYGQRVKDVVFEMTNVVNLPDDINYRVQTKKITPNETKKTI